MNNLILAIVLAADYNWYRSHLGPGTVTKELYMEALITGAAAMGYSEDQLVDYFRDEVAEDDA